MRGRAPCAARVDRVAEGERLVKPFLRRACYPATALDLSGQKLVGTGPTRARSPDKAVAGFPSEAELNPCGPAEMKLL